LNHIDEKEANIYEYIKTNIESITLLQANEIIKVLNKEKR